MWGRIVFSVAISNTDDHLRNHGFLLTRRGWVLSPAYDINPNPKGYGLSLNIDENDNSLDLDLCLSVCEFFRWKFEEAIEYIKRTKKIVSNWQDFATQFNASREDILFMENAFRV